MPSTYVLNSMMKKPPATLIQSKACTLEDTGVNSPLRKTDLKSSTTSSAITNTAMPANTTRKSPRRGM